jgi:hypothetical protein
MELSDLAPTRVRKQQNDPKHRVRWSPEEDYLLRSLVSDTRPNSWSAIAKFFPTKTPPQVSGRWGKVVDPRLVKGSWTSEEDGVILAFVDQNGVKDWARLAARLPGRTGKQCRERFRNHLDRGLAHRAWTDAEDEQLIDLHAAYGNRWAQISSFFRGRTDNCVKNRWNSTLKKRLMRIQMGEPLVQKRGRKAKAQPAVPAPPVPFAVAPETECTPGTSPLIQRAAMPFACDQPSVMMLARRKEESARIPTLAENRLDFQRMLGDLA